jgi:tRNA-2-methylthio-N6-dimethylallyladenosine synthase
LDAVSSKTKIERIRFTSPHPKDFPDDLLDLIAERDNICKQIHVPLQAGNDRVLKKMNRTYTQNEFLALTDKMKERVPNVALSTDIIIGFPTETYEEFLDTKKVCEYVKFDHAYIFKYSERPNTRAALKFPDDITAEEKTKRITELVQLQKTHSLEKNQRWVGENQEILVERIKNNQAIGRNDANVLVYTNNVEKKIGDRICVKIESASPHGLKASRL